MKTESAAASEVLDAALELGAQGTPVFPCDPANKRPLVATGFKAATKDRTTITTWWKQWPGAMIGIPTGEPSGLFVLDIDYDESKGLDRFAALAAMEVTHGPLPATWTQRAPRGGEHRLFSWPGFKIKNSASKLGAGLDIRGDGGYVIMAPSVNADGVPYEFIRECEPAAAPDWLLVLLDGPKPPCPGTWWWGRTRHPGWRGVLRSGGTCKGVRNCRGGCRRAAQ